MSSIRSDLETYTTAAEKLKEMRKTMKELTEVKNGAEKRIKEFLKSQEHPGVTFKGYKIYLVAIAEKKNQDSFYDYLAARVVEQENEYLYAALEKALQDNIIEEDNILVVNRKFEQE